MHERTPKGWTRKRLDHLGFVGRGKSKHRPRNDPSLYGGQYPFIQTGEVKAADLYIAEYGETYNEKGLAQSKLWPAGTLCITIAANIAETAILKMEACFPDSVVGFIANPKEADTRFVKYQIDTIKLRMQNISHGTTQDNLSLEKLLSFDLLVPPVPLQKQIGNLIGAYDELIEHNRRRIAILEEMARALYHEWFVNFLAPGIRLRKAMPAERKISGKDVFPEGWEIGRLGDQMVAIEAGKRPKGGATEAEDGVPSIGAENINGIGNHDFAGEKYVPRAFFDEMRRGIVRDRDVALYKDGAHIGRSSYFRDGFPHVECCVNEHVFLLRATGMRLTQNGLYLWLRELGTVAAIRGTNANAAQPGINQQSVSGLSVVVPDTKTAGRFDELVEPMLANSISLAKRSRTLRQTRDLLLPRLISGEVSVNDVAIQAADRQGQEVAEIST